MKTVRILNVDIRSVTSGELLRSLDSGILITPNVDHLVRLQHDREFYDIYRRPDSVVVCDSRILAAFSRLLPERLPEAIPGSSFFPRYYLHHAADADCRIFLLGAAEGVAEKAAERINGRVGRRMVAGYYSPPCGFENDEAECRKISQLIDHSGATVVVVGLGSPKQEKWIARHRDAMPGVRLWMALGATIDFEAGTLRRASQWVQKLRMEWFYRFCCEPRRLFRRYFITDVKIFYYLARQMTNTYINPFEL